MRVALLSLGLAACARAFRRSGDSCLWRPPPPCLACGIDEFEGFRALNGSTERQQQQQQRDSARNVRVVPEKPPPSKWEGPWKCVGSYCVFANRGFANGDGMVAITTRDGIETLKRIESSVAKITSAAPPYYVAEVPGKGLGMLANRTLHRGENIMTRFPAVLIHRGFKSSVPQGQQNPLLDDAVARLPTARREAFMAQMGHFGGPRVADIFATNSFQMDLGGPDGHHYGCFPEVSRFNHDCRPNVAFYIDSSLRHTTTVVRDVAPDEELTITYLDSAESRANRQDRARHAWGFECGCSQCQLSDAAAAMSDTRLVEIKEIERRISDPTDPGVTPGLLRKLVKLYKDERLEVEVAGAYTLVALNYNMLGDAKLAVKYAKLAEEALVIEGGPDVRDVEAMRVLATAPKEHFTWRARLQR